MTSTLASRRSLPHLSWCALLLLPVLPFAIALASSRSFAIEPGRLSFAFTLLMVGVGLSVGLPALLDRLGWRIRKEAEQLRSAWVVSLFVAQVPGIGGPDTAGGGGVVFGLTCALIAALTFGTEFQQRTMSALLSQPIDRRELWSAKMGVLGIALALHYLVFELSRLASGFPSEEGVDLGLSLGVIAVAVLAWATTPTWTLITRSVLAGLVFSVAAPLLVFAFSVALTNESTALAATLAFAVVYAAAGFLYGRRRWLRLEAPDGQEDTGAGLFVGAWPKAGCGSVGRRGWVGSFVAKELRLQTVTLATCAVVLVLSLLVSFAEESSVRRDVLQALSILFAAITVLLAGATPIAEERRLGTLDNQVLQPVSGRQQWWLKAAVSAAPALLAFLAASAGSGAESNPTALGILLLIAFTAFAFCFHASSGATNALRALLHGASVFAVGFTLAGLLAAVLPAVMTGDAGRLLDSRAAHPELWTEEAARLGALDLDHSARMAGRWTQGDGATLIFWLTPAALGVTSGVVAILALILAGRNYARPVQAPHRLLRQQALCLALFLMIGLTTGAVAIQLNRTAQRAVLLVETRAHLDIERRLSPAQLQLRRHLLGAQSPQTISPSERLNIRVRFFRPEPATPSNVGPAANETAPPVSVPRWSNRAFQFPLSPADRAVLIESGDLPPLIREALRREATPDPGIDPPAPLRPAPSP